MSLAVTGLIPYTSRDSFDVIAAAIWGKTIVVHDRKRRLLGTTNVLTEKKIEKRMPHTRFGAAAKRARIAVVDVSGNYLAVQLGSGDICIFSHKHSMDCPVPVREAFHASNVVLMAVAIEGEVVAVAATVNTKIVVARGFLRRMDGWKQWIVRSLESLTIVRSVLYVFSSGMTNSTALGSVEMPPLEAIASFYSTKHEVPRTTEGNILSIGVAVALEENLSTLVFDSHAVTDGKLNGRVAGTYVNGNYVKFVGHRTDWVAVVLYSVLPSVVNKCIRAVVVKLPAEPLTRPIIHSQIMVFAVEGAKLVALIHGCEMATYDLKWAIRGMGPSEEGAVLSNFKKTGISSSFAAATIHSCAGAVIYSNGQCGLFISTAQPLLKERILRVDTLQPSEIVSTMLPLSRGSSALDRVELMKVIDGFFRRPGGNMVGSALVNISKSWFNSFFLTDHQVTALWNTDSGTLCTECCSLSSALQRMSERWHDDFIDVSQLELHTLQALSARAVPIEFIREAVTTCQLPSGQLEVLLAPHHKLSLLIYATVSAVRLLGHTISVGFSGHTPVFRLDQSTVKEETVRWKPGAENAALAADTIFQRALCADLLLAVVVGNSHALPLALLCAIKDHRMGFVREVLHRYQSLIADNQDVIVDEFTASSALNATFTLSLRSSLSVILYYALFPCLEQSVVEVLIPLLPKHITHPAIQHALEAYAVQLSHSLSNAAAAFSSTSTTPFAQQWQRQAMERLAASFCRIAALWSLLVSLGTLDADCLLQEYFSLIQGKDSELPLRLVLPPFRITILAGATLSFLRSAVEESKTARERCLEALRAAHLLRGGALGADYLLHSLLEAARQWLADDGLSFCIREIVSSVPLQTSSVAMMRTYYALTENSIEGHLDKDIRDLILHLTSFSGSSQRLAGMESYCSTMPHRYYVINCRWPEVRWPVEQEEFVRPLLDSIVKIMPSTKAFSNCVHDSLFTTVCSVAPPREAKIDDSEVSQTDVETTKCVAVPILSQLQPIERTASNEQHDCTVICATDVSPLRVTSAQPPVPILAASLPSELEPSIQRGTEWPLAPAESFNRSMEVCNNARKVTGRFTAADIAWWEPAHEKPEAEVHTTITSESVGDDFAQRLSGAAARGERRRPHRRRHTETPLDTPTHLRSVVLPHSRATSMPLLLQLRQNSGPQLQLHQPLRRASPTLNMSLNRPFTRPPLLSPVLLTPPAPIAPAANAQPCQTFNHSASSVASPARQLLAFETEHSCGKRAQFQTNRANLLQISKNSSVGMQHDKLDAKGEDVAVQVCSFVDTATSFHGDSTVRCSDAVATDEKRSSIAPIPLPPTSRGTSLQVLNAVELEQFKSYVEQLPSAAANLVQRECIADTACHESKTTAPSVAKSENRSIHTSTDARDELLFQQQTFYSRVSEGFTQLHRDHASTLREIVEMVLQRPPTQSAVPTTGAVTMAERSRPLLAPTVLDEQHTSRQSCNSTTTHGPAIPQTRHKLPPNEGQHDPQHRGVTGAAGTGGIAAVTQPTDQEVGRLTTDGRLQRVPSDVVDSCSPVTHTSEFRDQLRQVESQAEEMTRAVEASNALLDRHETIPPSNVSGPMGVVEGMWDHVSSIVARQKQFSAVQPPKERDTVESFQFSKELTVALPLSVPQAEVLDQAETQKEETGSEASGQRFLSEDTIPLHRTMQAEVQRSANYGLAIPKNEGSVMMVEEPLLEDSNISTLSTRRHSIDRGFERNQERGNIGASTQGPVPIAAGPWDIFVKPARPLTAMTTLLLPTSNAHSPQTSRSRYQTQRQAKPSTEHPTRTQFSQRFSMYAPRRRHHSTERSTPKSRACSTKVVIDADTSKKKSPEGSIHEFLKQRRNQSSVPSIREKEMQRLSVNTHKRISAIGALLKTI